MPLQVATNTDIHTAHTALLTVSTGARVVV